jgi:Kef-type K+ transport system membrane component KefB
LAARLTGQNHRDALLIGTLMNARGLMELIVINVGYEMGAIPKSVFCMLVIMAVVTTFVTTPLVVRLCRGTAWEHHIRQAGFR